MGNNHHAASAAVDEKDLPMKLPSFISLLAFTALASAPVVAETLRSSSGFAVTIYQNSVSRVGLGVTQADNGPPGRPYYINYDLYRCGPYGCEALGNGAGFVGDDMVRVGPTTATISIPDITQIPNFVRQGSINTGSIIASFQRNGDFTYTTQGTTRIASPGLRVTIVGSREYGYAKVTGSVLGIPIPTDGDGIAEIARNRSVTVTIDRTP